MKAILDKITLETRARTKSDGDVFKVDPAVLTQFLRESGRSILHQKRLAEIVKKDRDSKREFPLLSPLVQASAEREVIPVAIPLDPLPHMVVEDSIEGPPKPPSSRESSARGIQIKALNVSEAIINYAPKKTCCVIC